MIDPTRGVNFLTDLIARKCNWERLVRKEISKTLNGYVQVENAEAESRRQKFELSKYRFLPKANGVRILLDFSSPSRSQSLRDIHAVWKDIQLKEPDVLGSSVSDHDDFYINLVPYLIHLRSQSGELHPLFLVVADVHKAFDSIDQGKLLDVVQCVLKDEHILKKCRLICCGKRSRWCRRICCGKRSRWVNNVLVLTDKNDTVSRFLALGIKAESGEETTVAKKNDLFIGFNASDHPEKVILPTLPDGRSKWRRLVDTALPFPEFFSVEGGTVVAEEQMDGLVVYEMKPYSCTLFETINSTA